MKIKMILVIAVIFLLKTNDNTANQRMNNSSFVYVNFTKNPQLNNVTHASEKYFNKTIPSSYIYESQPKILILEDINQTSIIMRLNQLAIIGNDLSRILKYNSNIINTKSNKIS